MKRKSLLILTIFFLSEIKQLTIDKDNDVACFPTDNTHLAFHPIEILKTTHR